MTANLKLENIGSHQGTRNYEINRGKITIFEGSNSSGKTTIIKSIATILSCPILSENLKNEANQFGILPKEDKDSPIVNIYQEQAIISLSYEKTNLKARLYKNGAIDVEFPKGFQGNENFLYACMLVKNSKIQRYIASGDDEFQWIVTEMSHAKKYEELSKTIDSYLRLINPAKDTIKEIDNNIGNHIKEIQLLKKKKIDLEGQLKIIENDIKNLPKPENPELTKLENEQSTILNDIKINRERLKGLERDSTETQKSLKEIDSDIKRINSDINRLNKEIEGLKEEISEIQGIDAEKEYNNIMKNQEEIKQIIEDLAENKKLRELHHIILNSRHESDMCPLCGSKIPTNKEKSSKKIEKIKVEITKLEKKKEQLEEAIETSDKKIKRVQTLKSNESKLKNKKKTIDINYDKLNEENRDKERIQAELKRIKDNISREKQNLEENENKKEVIEKEIDILAKEDKARNELYQKRKKVSNEIQKAQGSIETNEKSIQEKSFINLLDIDIPIEKAEKIIQDLSNVIDNVNSYLNNRINEQRRGAAENFNSTIKSVITELNLDEFKDISINEENYHLTVKRKGGKTQPLGGLSGAERGIIGGILQISCKQTYLKEIPFFVGDDIILELDPIMKTKFIEYLKKLAIEDDLYIIITRVSDNKELIQIEI